MTLAKSEIGRFPNAKWSALFLILHVSGVLFAVRTLFRAWNLRTILEVYWGKFAWLTFLCILAVLLLGVVQASRTLLRWRKREPELDVGIRLRGLFYAAVGCLLLNVTILRIRTPVMADISVVFAYGVYLLWHARLPQIRLRVTRRMRRMLDVSCMNAALGLILAEFCLRIVAVVWPMPLLMTDETDVSARLQANRVAPGSLRYGFPMNEGGHFDTPFETTNKKVVVSIGDSFANAGVPHRFHFTTVCERELADVEVYNMGFPAIGPREYLQLLKSEALPLNPDLIVFQIFIGNDLTEASAVEAGIPSWYDPDRYLVTVLWQRIRTLRREGRIDLQNGIRDALPEYDELTAQWPWLENPLLEQPTFSEDLFLNIESQRAQAVCRPNMHVYHWFFESLRKLEGSAKNVPIAFVLIPDEFQVNDGLWEQVVNKLDPADGPYDRDGPQKKILARLEVCGLPVLDLLPALRAAEPLEDGKRHVYHLQDTHFNVRGNAIAGKELAAFLAPLLAAPAAQHKTMASGATMAQSGLSASEAGTITQLVFGQPRCGLTMVDGWSVDEATDKLTYVWSEGPKSVLAMNLPVGEDLVMEFECKPFVFPGSSEQSIDLYFNGKLIANVPLRSGQHEYAVSVPKLCLVDNPDIANTIEFRYARADRPIDVLPNSSDTRSLAACWYRLSISRSVDDVSTVRDKEGIQSPR